MEKVFPQFYIILLVNNGRITLIVYPLNAVEKLSEQKNVTILDMPSYSPDLGIASMKNA